MQLLEHNIFLLFLFVLQHVLQRNSNLLLFSSPARSLCTIYYSASFIELWLVLLALGSRDQVRSSDISALNHGLQHHNIDNIQYTPASYIGIPTPIHSHPHPQRFVILPLHTLTIDDFIFILWTQPVLLHKLL